MVARTPTTQGYRSSAAQYGAFGAFVGVLLGAAYAIGGAIIDASTTGLNGGTALAMLALVGMPILFAAGGALAGILWTPIARRIPRRYGGTQADDAQ